MSIAWTTLAIIGLLLPGAAFLLGFASKDRYSKEIIRASAIAEIALALFISMILHLAGYFIVKCIYSYPLLSIIFIAKNGIDSDIEYYSLVRDFVFLAIVYTATLSLIAFGGGYGIARLAIIRRIKILSPYPWTKNLQNNRGGVITAYVMTKTTINNRVLMYKGVLEEFFLKDDGCLSYIVLVNCSRYIMDFGGESVEIGNQLKLFEDDSSQRRKWNYLVIDGDNISNILFDKVNKISEKQAGTKALEQELRQEIGLTDK